MNINNFDSCSHMENCELSCFYDTERSRDDFEDSFEVIQHSNRQFATAVYFFQGDKDCPSDVLDCLDLSEVEESDAREWILASTQRDTCATQEIIEEKNSYHDSWIDFLKEILRETPLVTYTVNGFPNIGKLLVESVSIRGYSQGDYAVVLYFPEDEGFLSNPSKAKKVFEDLCYNTPIYCRLVVDGEEYFLDEGLSNIYSFERDEIMEYAKKQGLSEKVLEWLLDNLPETPDYI